jgi:hypothetical protein
MKSKCLISKCWDGAEGRYVRGDEVVGDSEFHRKLLINGAFEPLDDAAKAVVADKKQVARFHSKPYAAAMAADIKSAGFVMLGLMVAVVALGTALLAEPVLLAALPFLALPVLLPLTDVGRNFLADAWINNGSPTFFDNSNARIGVGDDNTAFAKAQTDLQAAVNKIYDPMEATYPSIATNVVTFRSLLGTGEANWTWAEWGIFNGSPGTMACRKVEALGTKTSAQSWQITADITVNNP